jgi:di/tricarboxylate transporter
MGIEGLMTLAVVIFMIAALVMEFAAPELILSSALAVLIITGVLTPAEALDGFSNTGVVTVGVLFIVSAAIQNTGALNHFVSLFLGRNRKEGISLLMLRMMTPIAFLSAFVNNTPIVVIFAPIIKRWSEKLRLPASKFLIPLSYATVLGGICTLIGTSTNLVVHGLMIENGIRGLSMFELTKIGVPCTIAGLLYLAFIGKKILPERKDVRAMVTENSKEYVVEMKVKKGCELIGKNVEEAGLRNLRGLFLLDIERDGKSLGPITPKEVIEEEDRLVFVGVPSAVVDLQEIHGLVPAAHEMFEKDFSKMRTHLVEAVVSSGSPVLNKTVKECNFRAKYGAGVVAVHRNGERINAKVGSIRLKAGDTLLLFTDEKFIQNWKDSQDFYLISYIKDRPPNVQHKAYLVLGISVLMILGATLGESGKLPKLAGESISILHCAIAAVFLMLLTKCLPGPEARRSIKWDVLITIACSFGISKALQNSGTADYIGSWILKSATTFGAVGALAVVYLLTMLITELLTNNAAAALVFPIALSTASQLGVDPRPFLIAVTVAASASFMTPIGYQTHLIVQGAGGYKFSDYFKVGLPLNILVALVALFVIPKFWSF